MEVQEVLIKIGREKADLKDSIGRTQYFLSEAREKMLEAEKQVKQLENELETLRTVVGQLEEEQEEKEGALENIQEFENSLRFWTKNL